VTGYPHSLEGWSKVGKFAHRKERSKVEAPAIEVAKVSTLGQDTKPGADRIERIEPLVQQLILSLRKWSDKADQFTWLLFRVQTLSFLAAAAFIFISTVIYFSIRILTPIC
jgi:hypothetical protein